MATPTHGATGTAITMSRTYNSLEQLMETVDAQSGTTRYAYDGAGNPAIIEDAANNQITAWYDALGRKAWVDDPNMGRTDFTYNAFGELEKETDANGESIYYDMDRVGRVTQRLGDNGAAAAFEWDTVTDGLLTSQSVSDHSTTYAYDSAARVTTTTVTIGSDNYVTETLYDAHHGRPKGMVYPDENGNADGLTVEYRYNNHGYLTQERNAQSLHVYRQITAQDALGNIKEALINNGDLAGDYLYHSATGQMLHAKVGVSVNNSFHHYQYGDILTGNGYDGFGNLTYQTNEISGVREDYEYDTLHRLTKSTLSGSSPNHSIDYGYDVVGNLKKKSDYSENQNNAYTYVPGTNKLQSVALKNGTDTVTYGYDNKGNQTTRNGIQEVTYNVFNKPTFIDKNNSEVRLSYGADLARYKQVRTENANGPETTTTTYYIGKHYEVEITDTTTTRKHYISDVAIVSLPDTALAEIVYTHRDRLGSAVTMTDDHNQVVAERHFDPFGKPRKGKNWSLLESMGISATLANNEDDKVMATRRGFTDHEHLDQAELIHMNGRVYDYNVGRFMSVDPIVQSPGNSQSINPYSYIMNNPLAGTDPTGYVAATEEFAVSDIDKVEAFEDGVVQVTLNDGTVHQFNNVSEVTATVSNGATATFQSGSGSVSFSGDIGSSKTIKDFIKSKEGGAKANNSPNSQPLTQTSDETVGAGSAQGKVHIDWDEYEADPVAKAIIDSWLSHKNNLDDEFLEEESLDAALDYRVKNETRVAKLQLMRSSINSQDISRAILAINFKRTQRQTAQILAAEALIVVAGVQFATATGWTMAEWAALSGGKKALVLVFGFDMMTLANGGVTGLHKDAIALAFYKGMAKRYAPRMKVPNGDKPRIKHGSNGKPRMKVDP